MGPEGYYYALSTHASQRCNQRNLDTSDIEFVMRHGRRIYRTGAVFYCLTRRDIPSAFAKTHHRLVGSVVVQSFEGAILTLYRNLKAISDIKKKPKWRRPIAS